MTEVSDCYCCYHCITKSYGFMAREWLNDLPRKSFHFNRHMFDHTTNVAVPRIFFISPHLSHSLLWFHFYFVVCLFGFWFWFHWNRHGLFEEREEMIFRFSLAYAHFEAELGLGKGWLVVFILSFLACSAKVTATIWSRLFNILEIRMMMIWVSQG